MLQEAGYSAQDLARAADDAGVRMAIFNGIIRETRHQVGDAAKLADELGGALSRTEESTRKVHRAIGEAVEGPLRELLNVIQPILERIADWIERNKELVGAIITITTAVTALTAGGAAWLLLIPKISSALNLLAQGPVGWTILGLTALVTAFVSVKNAMQKAREEQERFIERKKEMADKIGYEARELHTLLDEYDRLTTKSNLSKEEHERLNEVIAEIGEIVPEAVTQWDSLGNAIEINAGKARDAVKDMLEARKALLEIATARAEAQKPILEATIEREETRVRKAEERFREAKENVNKAIRLQAEAKKLYDRLLAGEDVEAIYRDALAAGIVAYEGAPLPGALDFWLSRGIQSAEEELVKAAQNLDKVGQKYYDAKEKLAQLAGDEAELRAIIARMEEGDLYAGLDTSSPGGKTGGGENTTQLQQHLDLQFQLRVEHLKRIGKLQQAEIEEENQRYEKEREIAEGNRELLEEVEKAHTERLKEINDKYDQQRMDAEKKVQDEIFALTHTALETKLKELEDQKKAEIDAANKIGQDTTAIEEKYRLLREQAINEANTQEIILQKRLQATLLQSQREYKEAELLNLEADFLSVQETYKNNAEALKKIEETYQLNRLAIIKKYNDLEQEEEWKKQKYFMKQRYITKQDYLNYLDSLLAGEEQYTNRWYQLQQERTDTLQSIFADEVETLKERSKSLYKNEADQAVWLIGQLENLRTKYSDNKVVLAELEKVIKEIKAGIESTTEPVTNWFTDVFEEIGYKIEEAQNIFETFRDSLIDGFTEIITKGKSVGDVFKQILDYLAEMIVKKGIVEPIVDWVLGGIGLAHTGALVTPAGLVHDLPSYHSGGVVPGLRSDERIIKVLTGERILSREQNKKFEAGEYGKTEVTYEFNINAVDAASFVQLVRRNPEAITSVVAGDIVSDGPLRKTIMRYTK